MNIPAIPVNIPVPAYQVLASLAQNTDTAVLISPQGWRVLLHQMKLELAELPPVDPTVAVYEAAILQAEQDHNDAVRRAVEGS
jgi:hypothetical protein